ncbi:M35 family metallo-endopeptidase [Ekhidna sp.]
MFTSSYSKTRHVTKSIHNKPSKNGDSIKKNIHTGVYEKAKGTKAIADLISPSHKGVINNNSNRIIQKKSNDPYEVILPVEKNKPGKIKNVKSIGTAIWNIYKDTKHGLSRANNLAIRAYIIKLNGPVSNWRKVPTNREFFMPSLESVKERLSANKKPNGFKLGKEQFDNCTPIQRRKIANEIKSSLRKVIAARKALELIKNNPKIIPNHYKNLLKRHFRLNSDINIMLEKLNKIEMSFSKGLEFECDNSCKSNIEAYVPYYFFGLIAGDVHICFYYFHTISSFQRRRIIIHEIAHKYAGIDDHAYKWETSKYAGLKADKTIDNADSYAYFAMEL